MTITPSTAEQAARRHLSAFHQILLGLLYGGVFLFFHSSWDRSKLVPVAVLIFSVTLIAARPINSLLLRFWNNGQLTRPFFAFVVGLWVIIGHHMWLIPLGATVVFLLLALLFDYQDRNTR